MEFKRRASVMALVSSFRRRLSSSTLEPRWRNDSSNIPSDKRFDVPKHTDGGWGWVVVASAFFVLMTEMGIVQTLGIFVAPLEEEFSSGAAVMGVIASSCFATLCAMCPVGSLAVKRFGCRKTAAIGGTIMASGLIISSFMKTMIQLFLCLDILAGCGAAFVHMSATIAIGQYFNKRYALANGLAYTGQGFGLFIFPSLLQKLIEEYGWRGTLLIEGAIAFNIVAVACLFRPTNRQKSPSSLSLDTCQETPVLNNNKECTQYNDDVFEHNPSGKAEMHTVVACTNNNHATKVVLAHKEKEAELDNNRQRFKFKCTCKVILETPTVLVIYFVFLLQAVGFVAVTTHVVPQAIESGVSTEKATLTLSALGVGSLAGRAVHGIFIDKKLVTAKMGKCLAHLLCVVATIINPLTGQYSGIVTCTAMVGFASGWFFPLMQVILRQMVGLQRLPSAYGLGMLFEGVGCATGGYLAGYVKDVTGSYDPAFYFISGTFFLAMVVLLLEQLCIKRKKKKHKKTIQLENEYPMLYSEYV